MTKTIDRLEQLSPERRALLALKAKQQKAKAAAATAVIPKQPREEGENKFPLSFPQQRIMFFEEYMPGTERYNFANGYKLIGKLDVTSLHKTLNEIIKRHEIMRAVISYENDDYVQIIRPEFTIDLPVIELIDENKVFERMEKEATAPYDFLNGPLVKATLFRLDPEKHVLVWMTHHLIYDGWSADVFDEELPAIYRSFVLEEPLVLPELPIQYPDFAVWQRQWMTGTEYDNQLSYWKKKLTPVPATLDLPTDYPRPSIQVERKAGFFSMSLEPSFSQRIRDASKQLGCTSFVLLLAAYKVLLASYNGKKEIVVGTPMANRGKQEIEKLAGFFANTVALRSAIDMGGTFSDFIAAVRDTVLEANDHQDLPFDRLVDEVNPDRVIGHSLFFDTMFLFERHGQAMVDLPDLQIVPFVGDRTRGGMLDLTMTVFENQKLGMEVTLTYRLDLFRESTIQQMADHFCNILEHVLDNSELPLYTVAALSGDQLRKVLVDWNAIETSPADLQFPHLLAERQANLTPTAIAVCSEGNMLTYQELNERANRLAHYLRRMEIGPNHTVGLYMERTVDIIVGLLGILKAGGAYVPLDPKLPVDRLRMIAQEADVSVIVTEDSLADLQPQFDDKESTPIRMVSLDSDWVTIGQEDSSNPEVVSKPSDLMYVLFTSGSTGTPKGVAVEHRNYANYFEGIMQRLELRQGLSFAIVSTLAADLGTPMIWGALATGGTLHVIPYERAADPDAFASYCETYPIDVMKIVPSHMELLLGVSKPSVIIPRECLILAGEASHWGTIAEIRRLHPGCRIQNHYGPTETTVSVLTYEVPVGGNEQDHQAVLPLGRPLPNAPAYVLNDYLQPVPAGSIGELYIGGSAVTRGYYGRPDLTAERFLPNPFKDQLGDRMYRTGDLVRHLPNGTIQFIGRMDQQVKIRGYRVETGEIEHVLLQVKGLHDAVVTVREDEPGDKRLVAYLVPEHHFVSPSQDMSLLGAQIDLKAIRKYLKSVLPDYMLPSAFVEIERLPLNENGKLDRAKLPVPSNENRVGDSGFSAPETKEEHQIAAVWSEVLGLDKVGVNDEFFDLGGDSFKAIKVVRKMGNSFSVMDLFQYPTVRELAEHLTSGATRSDDLLIEFKKASNIGGKAITLVCVPYGGGSAITFQPLAKDLPPNYSLFAVELPGHDYSRHGQLLASLDETTSRIAEEIKSKVKGEVYLYGHCLGGAMVLRTALLLQQANVEVNGVFMAGTFPGTRLPFKLTERWHRMFPSEKWTSDKFARDMLRAFGGFDDEISPEEQKFVLRNLRHDAREAEDYYTALYALPEKPKLKAPISCIVGGADRMTEFYEERYLEWQDFSEDVGLHVVEHAGHYFHKHQSNLVVKIISQQIRNWDENSDYEGKQSTLNHFSRINSATQHATQQEQDKRGVQPSVKSFLMVTLCLIIATIGTSLTGFALGIWVYDRTGSISDYATISLYAILPTLLLLPLAGAVVDRYDRRKVMLAGQMLALCSCIFLATMLYLDALSLWAIYVAAGVGSIAGAFTMPAYQAATAQLVPKRYLGHANGLGQLVMSLNGIMAPALGGALVVLIGLQTIVILDLVLISLSIIILSLIRFPNLMFKKREEPMIREIVGGWKYIIQRKSLIAMVVFFVVVNFFMSLYNVLTTPFLLQFMTADKVGIVIAFEGAGLLIGSILMSIWGGFDRRADGMVGFVMLTGVSIVIVGIYPSLVTAAIGLFGFGLALALINTHWLSLIQTKVGLELQGRVLATNQVMAFSMRPLSFLLAGPLVASVFVPLTSALPAGINSKGLFGTGDGMGIGLLITSIGVILFVWGLLGMRYRQLRHMETILPDAVPDAVIIRDKDQLQHQADRQIGVGI
ncbi:non-ribosomal peptide synthetase/MFS transporter [Paenibacillus endoradicis]|uniref:non-ribosomal peptide synthetase/MFS transporter n=1 Tax=Paenibacillus endoradicis TaxID=2972487 RepID=UPI002158F055|nr:non-ribosomal peptide synthetase/MFS transporter [Paenibacillus endoradicis]MCR8656495.1 amino acid adenylation domain-containing protein [Paenibacillus endoradicis]